MAKPRALQTKAAAPAATEDKIIRWNPGVANEKQRQFFESQTLFTCYGGAKGGGKTWAVRVKAAIGALKHDGIKILIIRAHYPELEMNHIRPMVSMLAPLNYSSYNGSTHIMTFKNGSVIKFGHWSGDESENEYNGQEFDWIFIDEATQFSERAFNFLGGCMRGVNQFHKRMYLTCNPGGVGHWWVKRLFIDRKFKTGDPDPLKNEDPDDYTFIFASVMDNKAVLESSPHYLKNLAAMPNADAYLYGDWDAVGGNYFKEFTEQTHTVKPFRIPDHWTRYRSFDYGLDKFACLWWAVDEDGRCWCYRSYEQSDLNVQDAAAQALVHTLPNEKILITYAPPDVWSRMKDTGKTMAEIFMISGLPLVKADNNRVQGHMLMRYMMSPIPLKDKYVRELYGENVPDKLPQLMFFDDLGGIIDDIKSIQADEDNPNDCAKQPHEITHTVDACRYFCISRVAVAEAPMEAAPSSTDLDDDLGQDYESFMTGGSYTASYMNY